MAIQTIKATIQMRHGLEEDFDPDQMTAGEWAVSTDKKYVRMCFAPGLCIRMATYESFEVDMVEIQKILATCQDIQVAVDAMGKLAEQHSKEALDYSTMSKSYAVGGTGSREGEDSDNAKYYSEQAKAIAGGVRVTGVKGAKEETYRDGNVNLALNDIGAANGEIYGDTSVNMGRLEGSVIGEYSFTSGRSNVASGKRSTAFGRNNRVTGDNAFSCGTYCEATGSTAYTEGYLNIASGTQSHAEGDRTSAFAIASHSSGGSSVSASRGSHSEGYQTIAGGYVFRIESMDSSIRKIKLAEYYSNLDQIFSKIVVGSKLHVMDYRYVNTSSIFTVESINSSDYSVIVKENFSSTFVPGPAVLSIENNGYISEHAEGTRTTALGMYSHAGGYGTIATWACQTAIGEYNQKNSSGYFVIGNGASEDSRSNAFRVSNTGAVYGKGAYNSSGADYAEFIRPWHDGNENNEDRVGYFVTVKDGYLYKANEGDYIIGITSGNPSVVGNSDEEYYWRWERDEFNRIVYEEIPETKEEIDEAGKILTVETGNTVKIPKQSKEYDVSLQQSYVERKDRREWDYVGMIGVVPVRDDGSCEVGRYCKCKDGGIATIAEERGFDTYMVLDRISDNIVSVILK